jgi:hypothetical protein
MQPDLRDKVESAAASSGRSVNAEIVHRLEQSFTTPNVTKALGEKVERLDAVIASLVERLESLDPKFAATRAYFNDPKRAEEINSKRAEEAKKPQPAKKRRHGR